MSEKVKFQCCLCGRPTGTSYEVCGDCAMNPAVLSYTGTSRAKEFAVQQMNRNRSKAARVENKQ